MIRTRMTPPGPRGWLRKGALLSFPRDPEAFRRVAREHGDLASWRVGREQIFLVNHPDLVREAFVTKNDSFVKGWGPQLGNTILGSGLITAEGPLHRSQRRLLLPGFHRQRLEEYLETFVRHGRELCDRWPAHADVLNEVRRTTIGILGDTVLGADLAADYAELGAAADAVFRRFSGRMSAFAGHLRRLRVRQTKAAESAHEMLTGFAARVIAARRAASPGRDIVSMLLEARDEAGEPMLDQQIRDEIVTFFFAGHETISIALAWAWRLLARNPEAQTRLHAELDAVLGGRDPRTEDLRQLPFAQGVIAEALRLYPSQWMIGRRAIEDVTIGGCAVPRGAIVLLCLSALHRDARWFDDPEAFRPERWSAGVEKSAQPFTFLPFGVGVRRCVGEGFAWMQATALLAMLAARFAVEPLRRDATRWEALLLLRPAGDGRLQFRRRSEC